MRPQREHENVVRKRLESEIVRRKDVFALSHLAWTGKGYTAKFCLGIVDIVRTGVEAGVFDDPVRMNRLLDEVRRTLRSLGASPAK